MFKRKKVIKSITYRTKRFFFTASLIYIYNIFYIQGDHKLYVGF